jgi:hypothetical protein
MPSLLNRREEILFYQWTGDRTAQTIEKSSKDLSLRPLDLQALALAAMSYENDEDTLSYLLRLARRLHPKTAEGFALIDRDGIPLHFCRVGDFEAFEMKELQTRLSAPSPNAALIFDFWTPQSKRRCGYLNTALSLVARQVSNDGKEPWTFTSITNDSCRRSIEKAGFDRKYSMIYKKTLAWQRVSKVAVEKPRQKMEAQAGS